MSYVIKLTDSYEGEVLYYEKGIESPLYDAGTQEAVRVFTTLAEAITVRDQIRGSGG